MRWLSVSLIIILLAVAANAQPPVQWECTFTTAASYEGGNGSARDPNLFRVTPQALALTFLIVDATGYIVGNNGASEVTMVTTDSDGLQFIERVASGALQITAVDKYGNAVHSRHTVGFDGVLLGAQYYGNCRVL